MVKRLKGVDSLTFYYLKEKLAKFIYWCIKNGKTKDYIRNNL